MSDYQVASRAGQASDFGPGKPIVQLGGFSPLKDLILPVGSAPPKRFPPPPNAVYSLSSVHERQQEELTGSCIEHISADFKEANNNCASNLEAPTIGTDTTVSSGTGLVINIASSLTTNPLDKNASTMPGPSSKGELLADSIDFNRESWFTTTPGVSGLLWSAKDQREDFINEIDSGTPLEYCTKCQKAHIPPGPPLTLQDRDTCYSYLPEWFPGDGYKQITKPWETFTDLLKEIVILQECAMGYTHKQDPDRKPWNLEFHEAHPRWKEVGRKSGWWKCRSGPDAPAVERNCLVCRRADDAIEANARAARTKHISGAARMENIMEYMDKRMKVVAEKDKAIVKQRIRSEGWPQHLGISDDDLPPHILPSIQNMDAPPRDRLRWALSSGYLADGECSSAPESVNGRSSSNSFIL